MSNAAVSLSFLEGTGLEKSKELDIRNRFEGFASQISEWKSKISDLKVNSIEDTENMALAKEARLALVKVRTSAEKVKKSLKEDLLKEGRVIDTIYNFIADNIKPLEADLREKEEFAIRFEQKRLDDLEDNRKAQLLKYCSKVLYNVRDISDAEFDEILELEISNFEARQKRKEFEESALKQSNMMSDSTPFNHNENPTTDKDKILAFQKAVSLLPKMNCTESKFIEIEKELLQFKDGIISFIDKKLATV